MSENKPEFNINDYVPILIEGIRLGVKVPFDCFLLFIRNNRVIPFIKRDTFPNSELIEKLNAKKLKNVYIYKQDLEHYQSYIKDFIATDEGKDALRQALEQGEDMETLSDEIKEKLAEKSDCSKNHVEFDLDSIKNFLMEGFTDLKNKMHEFAEIDNTPINMEAIDTSINSIQQEVIKSLENVKNFKEGDLEAITVVEDKNKAISVDEIERVKGQTNDKSLDDVEKVAGSAEFDSSAGKQVVKDSQLMTEKDQTKIREVTEIIKEESTGVVDLQILNHRNDVNVELANKKNQIDEHKAMTDLDEEELQNKSITVTANQEKLGQEKQVLSLDNSIIKRIYELSPIYRKFIDKNELLVPKGFDEYERALTKIGELFAANLTEAQKNIGESHQSEDNLVRNVEEGEKLKELVVRQNKTLKTFKNENIKQESEIQKLKETNRQSTKLGKNLNELNKTEIRRDENEVAPAKEKVAVEEVSKSSKENRAELLATPIQTFEEIEREKEKALNEIRQAYDQKSETEASLEEEIQRNISEEKEKLDTKDKSANEVDQLNEFIEKNNSYLQNLEDEAVEKIEIITELQHKLEEEKNKVLKLENVLEGSDNEISMHQSESDNLRNVVNDLRMMVADQSQELKRMAQVVSNIDYDDGKISEATSKELASLLNEKEVKVDKAQADANSSRDKLRQLQSKFVQLQGRMEGVNNLKKKCSNMIDEINSERKLFTKQEDKLNSKLSLLTNLNAQSRKTAERLAEMVEKLKEEKLKLSSELAKNKSSDNQFAGKQKQLEDTINAGKQRTSRAEELAKRASEKQHELQARYAQENRKVIELEKELKILKRRLNEAA